MPNVIQIGQKTIFCIGQFWLVGWVGQKMVVGISNSFYEVFPPLFPPYQVSSKSDEKRMKNVENFYYLSVWVTRAGRSKTSSIQIQLRLQMISVPNLTGWAGLHG